MSDWGNISVGWFRVYETEYLLRAGTWRVVFFPLIEGFIHRSQAAVVDDFGNLVAVPESSFCPTCGINMLEGGAA